MPARPTVTSINLRSRRLCSVRVILVSFSPPFAGRPLERSRGPHYSTRLCCDNRMSDDGDLAARDGGQHGLARLCLNHRVVMQREAGRREVSFAVHTSSGFL